MPQQWSSSGLLGCLGVDVGEELKGRILGAIQSGEEARLKAGVSRYPAGGTTDPCPQILGYHCQAGIITARMAARRGCLSVLPQRCQPFTRDPTCAACAEREQSPGSRPGRRGLQARGPGQAGMATSWAAAQGWGRGAQQARCCWFAYMLEAGPQGLLACMHSLSDCRETCNAVAASAAAATNPAGVLQARTGAWHCTHRAGQQSPRASGGCRFRHRLQETGMPSKVEILVSENGCSCQELWGAFEGCRHAAAATRRSAACSCCEAAVAVAVRRAQAAP